MAMKHFPIRVSILNDDSKSLECYFKDIRKYKLMTSEEKEAINDRIKNGDKSAREELVLKNLRIVISLGKQYLGKGVDLPDLISAGNAGLIAGAERYNPDMGVEFVSYASWWIRDAMLKEIMEHGKSIRVPTEKITKMNKINRVSAAFEQENGYSPSNSELAKILGMEEDLVKDIISQCTINMVAETNTNQEGEPESIFETLYLEEGNTDKNLKRESVSQTIMDFLRTNLNEIELKVINDCFGLNGPEKSMDVVGEQLGITKERVRQIKDKAIIKLRKSNGIELLANYL